jgi:hypothetical protein
MKHGRLAEKVAGRIVASDGLPEEMPPQNTLIVFSIRVASQMIECGSKLLELFQPVHLMPDRSIVKKMLDVGPEYN